MKTRLALRRTGEYNGIFHCGKKLYQAEGIRVFYRGYIPNLLGILPYAGIDLAVYEVIMKYSLSHIKGDQNQNSYYNYYTAYKILMIQMQFIDAQTKIFTTE